MATTERWGTVNRTQYGMSFLLVVRSRCDVKMRVWKSELNSIPKWQVLGVPFAAQQRTRRWPGAPSSNCPGWKERPFQRRPGFGSHRLPDGAKNTGYGHDRVDAPLNSSRLAKVHRSISFPLRALAVSFMLPVESRGEGENRKRNLTNLSGAFMIANDIWCATLKVFGKYLYHGIMMEVKIGKSDGLNDAKSSSC